MDPFITDVTADSFVSLSNISVTFCTWIFGHGGGRGVYIVKVVASLVGGLGLEASWIRRLGKGGKNKEG